MTYNFKDIESKWRRRWEAAGKYTPDITGATKPYYNLMMFPYPSADGLHVGNMFSFVGADIQGRYRHACGYDVFEPMGFDAFGMHSENYAIKTESHPMRQTEKNVKRFRDEQLRRIGNMFDWSHEVNTTDPGYYRWTQWIFLQLHKAGLAYQTTAPVNWCPSCKTVLADEQAAGGTCERCGADVVQRVMKQWFFRITQYAERLLANLESLDWSDVTKAAQRRWIGKSEGTEIIFPLVGESGTLAVFTTRPETLWGVTFLVVSPMSAVSPTEDQAAEVARYKTVAAQSSDPSKQKTGVFTGRYVIHPCTGEEIPVWMSDYVVEGYGTGAIMAVPAHDARDREFAEAYSLPVVEVITRNNRLMNSGKFSGMCADTAKMEVSAWLKDKHSGKRTVRYHLHDWCISRQRYWGTPIPMIHCPECGAVPANEEDLPVRLPHLENYLPDGSGESPLARDRDFCTTACPQCGHAATRETDVCDNFLDSSWYYLRYPSAGSADIPFDRGLLQKWLPVDMYVGGNEHAVLHLMYSRFITMALHDAGRLDFEEPFRRFRANGMIVKDGAKMSKSKGNVIIPDDYLDTYGADVLRTYLMFSGDFAEGGDFRDANIVGIARFMDRFWFYYENTIWNNNPISEEITREVHKRIKRVTTDIERFSYNTAIAALMELLRIFERNSVSLRSCGKTLASLFAPFAPFICHEVWEGMGESGEPDDQGWPIYVEAQTLDNTVEIVVQVNGAVKDKIHMERGAGKEPTVAKALTTPKIVNILGGGLPTRIVYVDDRLVNIVIK